jgi:RimJ/RimL family protein N-acetyltransferase
VITLQAVDAERGDDVSFLYELLKERPADANISHRSMPTYPQHVAFVRSNPYNAWYLVQANGVNVGSVYITKLDEIGVFILAAQQRKGYAEAAVKLMMEMVPRPRYLANVAPVNLRSHALFTKLGGKQIQITYELQAGI